MELYEEIKRTIIEGRFKEVEALINKALNEGNDPDNLVKEACIPAMKTVGEKFESKEFFLPEMIVAAHTVKVALDILEPLFSKKQKESQLKAVVATVEGDQHDIGKNLVIMMFKGAGFQVIDLGVDVPSVDIVKAVVENKPEILGLSALLTTTIPRLNEVIDGIKKEGVRDDVLIVVGGAPVNQDVADSCGADIYARDPPSGVLEVEKQLGK